MRLAKIFAVLLLLVVLIVAARVLPVAVWLQEFQAYVRSIGPAGYILYALCYALCCVLLIPALALTLGAGAIFGLVAGSLVVMVGATAGAAAAFLLGRTVFRRRVEEMMARKPKLAAIDRAIVREGTKIMLLMRISGFPPFTWTNYALAVTGVRFTAYLVTTFFGIIPGVIAYTWAGTAGAAALTGSGNRVSLIITAVGGVLVVSYLAHVATRAIRRSAGEQ